MIGTACLNTNPIGTIEWGLPKHFVETQVDMNAIHVTKSARLIQTSTRTSLLREKR